MAHWIETVDVSDVWHNNDKDITELRDTVVARIKATRWWRNRAAVPAIAGKTLTDVVEGIAAAEDVETFDRWWNDMYDLADRDRVWIDTLGGGRS